MGNGRQRVLPVVLLRGGFSTCARDLHDFAALRSVHPVTLAGGAVVATFFAVSAFVMPNTEVGRSFVYGLYNLMR